MSEKMPRTKSRSSNAETTERDALTTTIEAASGVYGVVESLARIRPVQEALTLLTKKLGNTPFMHNIAKALELVPIPKQKRSALSAVLPLIFAIHAGVLVKDMDVNDMADSLNKVYGQYQNAKRAEQNEVRRSSEFEKTDTSVTAFLDTVRPYVEELRAAFPVSESDLALQNAQAFVFGNLFYPTNTGIARLSFTEGDDPSVHGTEAWFYNQLAEMTGRKLNVDDLIAHLPPIPERTTSSVPLTDIDAQGMPLVLPLREVVERSPEYKAMKRRIFEIYASPQFQELHKLSHDTGYLMAYEILIDGDIAQEVSPALYTHAKKIAEEDPDFFRHVLSVVDPRTGAPFA